MIENTLAHSLGIVTDAVPKNRLRDFAALASQTSHEERESLYAVSRYAYTGEGDIWDIGCAAGGSSFCLAAGIQDKTEVIRKRKIKCFDLFDGYSADVFKERFASSMSDLDIFCQQTNSVHDFVKPIKMDLAIDLDAYQLNRPIELVHIDAAKSLELWKSIFSKISMAIIPNKTIWIFQDFDRARLPWQIYSLAELIEVGEIIGGASYGTVYFKFTSEIDISLREKIIRDDFSIKERIKNVRSIFNIIRANHMSFFPEQQFKINDLENTVLAYCHYWENDIDQAQKTMQKTSTDYLSLPGNEIYSRELFPPKTNLLSKIYSWGLRKLLFSGDQ